MATQKNRTLNSAKNVLMGSVGQLVQTLCTFVNRMVFVRCLSEEYLGVNGLFTNLLSVLSLAELGLGTAIIYELYRSIAVQDDDKTAGLMKLYGKAYRVIGLVVGAIGLLLLPFLDFFIASPPSIHENLRVLYIIYLTNTVITYFFAYKRSILSADQKNYIISGITAGVNIVLSVLQIVILLTTKNFILYLTAMVIMTFTGNFIISQVADKMYPIIKKKDVPKLPRETIREMVVNVRAMVIRKLSGTLVSSTDNIIISAILGLSATGITSNYVMLTTTLNTLLAQVFSGITASIGNVNALESKEKQMKIFYVVNFLNFWLFGWCAISFLVLSDDIVGLAFGKQYVLSFAISCIMAINFYTNGMQNAIWTYRSTLGLFDKGKYLTLITGVLNIFFSIILGKYIGIFGILVATFISRLLTNIWYEPYSIFKYGFKERSTGYFGRYIQLALVTVLGFILTYSCCYFIRFENDFIRLFIRLIICVIVPNLFFIVIYHNKEEFVFLRDKLSSIIKKNNQKRML